MDYFKKAIDYLVREYFFLAFIVASFTLFTYESIAVDSDIFYVLGVAMGTLLLYKYISPLKSYNQLLSKNNFFLGVFTLLLFVFFAFNLQVQSLLFFGLAGLVSLLYFFGWPSFIKPLREYLLLKPFIIGLVYSILIVQIPMQDAQYLGYEYMYSMAAILLLVSGLAIVFDMGDVEEDSSTATFPKFMGIIPSKILVTLLMVLASGAMFYSAWTYMIGIPESVAFSFSCLIGTIMAWKATPTHSKMYYLLYVDGVMALPYGVTLFFNML